MTERTADEMRALISARATGRIKGDASTDITLTAPAQVFYDIAMGNLNPATAFMMRKLKVDGNPMRALKVGEILSTAD